MISSLRQGLARPLSRLVTLLCLCAVAGTPAAAQELAWPQKPVRLVVSYAAGNVTDVLARIVADQLTGKWGQAVVVDNKPGLGGSLGAQLAAKAPNDGYTLLFSAMAALAINPHVYPNVGYNPVKDFAPIINVASPEVLVVVPASLNIQTFAQLLAWSKANPSAVSYGSAGNGTVPHLNIETLKIGTGLIAQHVPYKAANAALTDLVAGRIQLQSDAMSVLMPQVSAGKLVAIMALTSNGKRHPQLPNVPTMMEVAPGLQPVITWLGMLAPAGTAPAIVTRTARDVAQILTQREVQEKFVTAGLTIQGEGPEAFARTIAADVERLGKLARDINLKMD